MNNKFLLLLYLILLAALPPTTTDMYLPALPMMVEQFNSTVGTVNLTLGIYFAFFSASILIWGTLSDKYGRKPIIILCLLIYIVSGLLCAASTSIIQLIIFRVFQAIGGGATIAVCMAIMKDVYEGKERERALSLASIFMVIAPITAPSIGAIILKIMSWRGIFIALSGLGCIALIGSLLLKETSEKSSDVSLIGTLGNLLRVLKIPGFSFPLPLFSVMTFPILMFVGASADIYITKFGLNEQVYGLFFGGNAFFGALGPVIFMLLSKRFQVQNIISANFIMLLFSGLIVILFGGKGPLIFALTVIPATTSASMIRPPSANLLLEQVKKDAGAASSLMNFTAMLAGSMAMQFISLEWSNRILIMGLIYLMTGLTCLLLWPIAWKNVKSPDKRSRLSSYEKAI